MTAEDLNNSMDHHLYVHVKIYQKTDELLDSAETIGNYELTLDNESTQYDKHLDGSYR